MAKTETNAATAKTHLVDGVDAADTGVVDHFWILDHLEPTADFRGEPFSTGAAHVASAGRVRQGASRG